MGNRAQGILGSLPILAVAYGRRHGVEVIIGGNDACTDGKTIRIPALPLDCDEALETEALGYLHHETGHIEFTDIDQYQMAETPFIVSILQGIEDVRMEAARNAKYVGSHLTLSRLVKHGVAKGWWGTPETIDHWPPQDVLSFGILMKLRNEVLQQPCAEIATLLWERVNSLLGDAGTIKLEALLGLVNDLDCTADSLALSRRIATMIEDTAREPESPQQSSPSNDSSQSNDPNQANNGDGQSGGSQSQQGQDQSGTRAGQRQETGEQSGQGKSKQKRGKEASKKRDGQPDGDAGGGGSPQGSPEGKSPDRDALSNALSASADQCKSTDLGTTLGKALSKTAAQAVAQDKVNEQVETGNTSVAGPVDKPLGVTKRQSIGQGELPEVLASSQQLRTRLAAVLQAQARAKVTHRLTGNRIDGKVIHRLFTNNSRLFKHKEVKRKVNTAGMLLLDKSISMNDGGRMTVARKAALATCSGVSQIPGCKIAAAAFPEIEILKDFEESERSSAGRFVINAGGGTPMGKAMVWAATRLAARREERKFLIVVTDGAPGDKELVKRMIKMYAQAGIEVIGVGIKTQAVHGLFPTAVVIDDLNQLAPALFGVLQHKLRSVA